MKQEDKNRQNSWQQAKHVKRYPDLPGFVKADSFERYLGSLTVEGTFNLFLQSMVPHDREERREGGEGERVPAYMCIRGN